MTLVSSPQHLINVKNESGSEKCMNYLLNYIKIEKISKNGCPILDTLVSGSPVIQDGKLVGAVTHVCVRP